jgi:hypothetical protein
MDRQYLTRAAWLVFAGFGSLVTSMALLASVASPA